MVNISAHMYIYHYWILHQACAMLCNKAIDIQNSQEPHKTRTKWTINLKQRSLGYETTMSRKNGKDRTVLEKPPRFGLGEHLQQKQLHVRCVPAIPNILSFQIIVLGQVPSKGTSISGTCSNTQWRIHRRASSSPYGVEIIRPLTELK